MKRNLILLVALACLAGCQATQEKLDAVRKQVSDTRQQLRQEDSLVRFIAVEKQRKVALQREVQQLEGQVRKRRSRPR